MKRLTIAGAALAMVATPALGQDNEQICGAYAAIGEVMAGELLDRTMREFIGVAQGTNTELLNQITNTIATSVNGAELMALGQLDPEDAELLGEAAGQTAITSLMEGRASDAVQVRALMKQNCASIGVDQVLDNQRAVRAAMASNMSE